MTSPRKARSLTAALVVLAGVALAGCAPAGSGSTPTPGQTSAPPKPTASSTPTETPVAFTEAELVQVCIDATTSEFDPDVLFDATGARVEKRTVTPEWLVLVPAQTLGYAGEAQCTIGGSPTKPDIDMAAGSIERLSEEKVQSLIRGEGNAG